MHRLQPGTWRQTAAQRAMRGARACILAWQPPLKHRLADASKLLPSTPLLPVYHQLRCRLRHASRRCRSRHLGRRRARHVCALRQVRRRAGRGSASSCPAVQPPLAALCWGVGTPLPGGCAQASCLSPGLRTAMLLAPPQGQAGTQPSHCSQAVRVPWGDGCWISSSKGQDPRVLQASRVPSGT